MSTPKTGKVNCIAGVFEWSVDDFSSLSSENKDYVESPSFSFAGESWYLNMYPNGDRESSSGYISLYLNREMSGPPISLTFFFAFKTFDGKKNIQYRCEYVYEKAEGWGFYNFILRSTLSEKKSELLSSDILTIVCSIQHTSNSTDYAVTEKILKDLKSILESKEHSDVTVKVKDTEFRLHRNILAGRNPYFSSMFKTDMKEKTTGIVSIDDCDPDIFEVLSNFLYTGETSLSHDNVCAVYEVADKYQEDQLKEKCLFFMANKVSVDSFCDFTVLALKFDEKEVLESATNFFCLKVKEIIRSVKWQTFMKEYPTQANELYIKAADHGIDKTA